VSYNDVFGTGSTLPSTVSYVALALSADQALSWPFETASAPNLLAQIIDITPSLALALTLPDATQGSTGYEAKITNLGSFDITVKNADGITLQVISAGQTWVAYLAANTTAAGTWRFFQMGSIISQASAGALAGNGLVAVGATLATDFPAVNFSGTTSFGLTDRAKLYRWTGGAGSCTMAPTSDVPVGWYMAIRNDGSGSLTVNAGAGDTLNGAASITLNPTDSCYFIAAAAGIMVTLGLGRSVTSTFDYTSIAVAGSGNYTLSGSELNRISYKFTGILTGDRTIIVPATVQQYWIDNSTTGAFNFYVKTLAQAAPGVQVSQNQRAILYCDSNNVLDADTAGISTPISIANGGTNATTASGARTNLGSTAVGDALFTAVTATAARATLGSGATGDALFTAATAAAARATIDAASLATANSFTNTQTITLAAAGTVVTLVSTDAGASSGPNFVMDRQSASAAISDTLGSVQWLGRSSTNVSRLYADVETTITSPTNAAESATLLLRTIQAGAFATRLNIGNGVWTNGATGGDQGSGTINATNLFINGVAVSTTAPPSAASQAQMEAAAVNTVFAAPSTVRFSPFAIKGYCRVDNNGAATLRGSAGVSSVNRTAVGTVTINFSSSFSAANAYSVVGICDRDSGGRVMTCMTTTQNAGSCVIETVDNGNSNRDCNFFLIFAGDLP
jgi:hypothetical protein